MRDYACEAAEMVQDRTRAHLDSDRMLNLALVRLLEILGEAANRVPTQARTQFAQIPWPQLIALRNRLIHGYDIHRVPPGRAGPPSRRAPRSAARWPLAPGGDGFDRRLGGAGIDRVPIGAGGDLRQGEVPGGVLTAGVGRSKRTVPRRSFF